MYVCNIYMLFIFWGERRDGRTATDTQGIDGGCRIARLHRNTQRLERFEVANRWANRPSRRCLPHPLKNIYTYIHRCRQREREREREREIRFLILENKLDSKTQIKHLRTKKKRTPVVLRVFGRILGRV